jgi:hypothetical protein
MATLRIYDLGRAKKSAQFVVDDRLDADDVAREIYRAVRRMKALMSKSYECTFDAEKGTGEIWAGDRIVGHVETLGKVKP